ncbi:MAG: helix-turn-helix domain-containing protein [Planctomycetota bacterium]
MSIKAVGRHYFDPQVCPVTAVRVAAPAAHRGGDAAVDPPGSHPFDLTEVEHDHDFNELVIVTAGRATHHLKGYAYPVALGDVFLLQSEDRHYFSDRDGLELLNVMYDPDLLDLPVEELRQIPGFNALFLLEPMYRRRHRFASRLHLPPAELQTTVRLAVVILDEVQRQPPGYAIAAKTKLFELMIALSRQYDRTQTTEGQSLLRLGSVIGELEKSYDQPWTVEAMADAAHLSPSHLVRVFRKATGQTPLNYLIQLRLRQAVRLLEDTDLNITQIAHQVGFADSNYFARQFRKTMATTPTQYRKAHRYGTR